MTVKVYSIVRSNDVGCERCGCRKQSPGTNGLCSVCEYEQSVQQNTEALKQ